MSWRPQCPWRFLLLLLLFVDFSDSKGACDDQPCKNGAICREREIPASIYWDSQNRLPYECQCLYGWEGENCTENVDDCKDNPCLNGGICEDQPNARYVCHCPAGYIGRKCEHRDPCLNSPCENGGQCQSSPLGEYQCFCPRWYEGTNCEIAKQPCKRNSTCREGTDYCEVLYEPFKGPRPGTTGSRISGFRCVCKPGYEGVLCERETDNCRNNRCQNGAQCVNLIGRYRCDCAPGFTGDYCQNPVTSLSRPNYQLKMSDSEMTQFCQSIGCSVANMSADRCNGRCVLAGCFDDQQLRICAPWTQCLEASKTAFRVGERTCVERFRDGVCDRACAIASCFQDGFDCLGEGSACPAEAHCSSVYGNGVCNSECASPGCGFDGGDCAATPPTDSLPPGDQATGTQGYIAVILDANLTAFEAVQRDFLSQLATMLRAVVRTAKDEQGNARITDLDSGHRIRVTLFVDLLPENHTKPNTSEAYQTVDEAAQGLTAALASHALVPPLPVAQLWSAKDPNEIQPGQVPLGPPDKQQFFRAKDAIALYICFCTLAGALIILLVFVVIQRRPWKQAAKRVRTSGIWFPHLPFSQGLGNYSHGRQAPGGGSAVTSESTPANKNEHNSAASQLEDILQPSGKRPRYSGSLSLPDIFDEGVGLLCSDRMEAFTSAAPRSGGVYPKPVMGPGGQEQPQAAFRSTEAPPRTPNLQRPTARSTAAALTSELTATMGACDGLHPISTDALTKMEHIVRNSQVLQQQQQRQQQNLLKRSYSAAVDNNSNTALKGSQAYSLQPMGSGPPGADAHGAYLPPTRGGCGAGAPGAEKLQHQECFVTTRNPLNGETILHLAARMNVGARAIRRLCGSLVAEEGGGGSGTNAAASDPSLALLCLDKDGRSPLTASAATDGIETTTALYRLEREAITCSRSSGSSHAVSAAGGEGGTEKPAAESRRRTRQIEIRRSTPLMVSLKAGCSEVTKLLLDEGCSIQGVDETGRNLVHWAAVLNAAPLLIRISHTKGFTRMLEARDDCDRTPLMLAVRENSLEAAQILLEHQAAIDVYDYTDSCPIDEATARGLTRMLALLMEYKQRRSASGSRLAESAASSSRQHSASKDLPPGSTPSSSSSTSGGDEDEEGGDGGGGGGGGIETGTGTGSELGAFGGSSSGGGGGAGVGDQLAFQSPNQPFSSAYPTPSQVSSSPQQPEDRGWQPQPQPPRTNAFSDLLLEKQPKLEERQQHLQQQQNVSPLQMTTWSPASKGPSPPSSSSTASSYWQPQGPPGAGGLVNYGNPVEPTTGGMTYAYNQICPMGEDGGEPQFPTSCSISTAAAAELTTPPVYNQLPNGYNCPSGTNSSTNSTGSSSHSAVPDQQGCFQVGGGGGDGSVPFKFFGGGGGGGGVADCEPTKPAVFDSVGYYLPQGMRRMSPGAAAGFLQHPTADPSVAEESYESPKTAHMVAARSGRGYLMGRPAAPPAATPVDIRSGQSARGMFALQL